MYLDKTVYWSRILLLGLAVGEQMPRLGTAALPCGWAMSGAGGVEYESQWNWGGSSCSQDVQVTHDVSREALQGSHASKAPQRQHASSCSHLLLED